MSKKLTKGEHLSFKEDLTIPCVLEGDLNKPESERVKYPKTIKNAIYLGKTSCGTRHHFKGLCSEKKTYHFFMTEVEKNNFLN